MDLNVKLPKLSDADGGGEDRLSALPDDLLIHILVLVGDAAAAGRTSILASRWRRIWALLPVLRFASIEHRRIGAALAAHEAPDLSLLSAVTEDASPESLSAWLTIAARVLSGTIKLEVAQRESESEAEDRGAIDLPCFEKATTIMLELGFLGLALPPSGVFARLRVLQLVAIQLHGKSSGLGDLLSSQHCPSLRCLVVRDVRRLDIFNIHSDSLLYMELSDLQHLQQLTVMASVLFRLKVSRCFVESLNPDVSFANISAPQLASLRWKNVLDPSSIQLNNIMHLKTLGIELFILEEALEHNHNCMTLLRRFEHIHTLDLLTYYPPNICTGSYLMEHMPRLPDITSLDLGVIANGHSFGARLFDVLRRCTGVKELGLKFFCKKIYSRDQPTMCPSGCICDQPTSWRTEELALNCLEEIEICGMRGTEHEFFLVQRLFHWARALKRIEIIFHESTPESKAEELRQLLRGFSDICMSISISVT